MRDMHSLLMLVSYLAYGLTMHVIISVFLTFQFSRENNLQSAIGFGTENR